MNKNEKSPFVIHLLEYFSDDSFVNSASGDVEEMYWDVHERSGRFRAQVWIWKYVLKSLPYLLLYSYKWSLIMFTSYFKTGLRNLLKNRSYAFVNISGLAVGLACSLLIALFVVYELSFDNHHENADRIYRVNSVFTQDKRISLYTAPPMAGAMKEQFPEVESIVRVSTWTSERLLKYEDRQILEKQIYVADNSFFDVFTLPLIDGDSSTALDGPNKVVISESIAQKLFGDDNPVGKAIDIRQVGNTFQVTGVFRNIPKTSHLDFEVIESLSTYDLSRRKNWMSHTFNTYMLLREGASPEELASKFPEFIIKNYGPQFYEQNGRNLRDYIQEEKDYYYNYSLQPLEDIYLDAENYFYGRGGDLLYVKVFSLIAVLVVLLACINFINLATAQFARRAREIGLRKTLGAVRQQLIKQFLFEAVIISMAGLVISYLIVYLSLPAFNVLTGKFFTGEMLLDLKLTIGMICVALLAGLVSGGYPAIYMSGLRPVDSIRSPQVRSTGGTQSLRRLLVILQFAVSFSIIVIALAMYNQMEYMNSYNLGFDSEKIIVIKRSRGLGEQRDTFIRELQKRPEISVVSSTNSLPGRHFDTNSHTLEGWESTKDIMLHTMYSDHAFKDLLGLRLVDGRFFSPDIPTDLTHSVVINQSAVSALGLTDPVGKRIHKEFGGAKPGEFVTIIGVIENINFLSLHRDIEPMILRPQSALHGDYTSVRFTGDNIKETVEYIESVWKDLTNGQPFAWSVFSDDLRMQYSSEMKTGKIMTLFSLLSVFIAVLGLFGLVSYTTSQRTREIGIRKVLGAGLSDIVVLLTKELVILIVLSSLFAAPAAFYFSRKWLENFAYRMEPELSIFLLPLLFLLGIATLTSATRVIAAALRNPVESLKHE